jgi:hypothetical protein
MVDHGILFKDTDLDLGVAYVYGDVHASML